MEKWNIVYTPTQEELYRALKYGDIRRVGKAGRIVESVILGLLAVWCIVPFIAQGAEALNSLLLGLLALILLAALWLVPEWRARSLSRQEARDRRPTRIRVYDEGLRYGEAEEIHAFGTEVLTTLPGLYILRYGTELMPLPHRALPDDCLAFLREKWEENTDGGMGSHP